MNIKLLNKNKHFILIFFMLVIIYYLYNINKNISISGFSVGVQGVVRDPKWQERRERCMDQTISNGTWGKQGPDGYNYNRCDMEAGIGGIWDNPATPANTPANTPDAEAARQAEANAAAAAAAAANGGANAAAAAAAANGGANAAAAAAAPGGTT